MSAVWYGFGVMYLVYIYLHTDMYTETVETIRLNGREEEFLMMPFLHD
jgi:hypothetical protein